MPRVGNLVFTLRGKYGLQQKMITYSIASINTSPPATSPVSYIWPPSRPYLRRSR